MLALCFPGFEWSASLVWIWPVPLLLALWLGELKGKRVRFLLGLVAGLSFWLINLKWLIAMGEMPTVPVAGALLAWGALSLYLAVYFGLWSLFVGGIANPWRVNAQEAAVEVTGIEQKMAAKIAAKSSKKGKKGGFIVSMRVMRFALMQASLWVVLEFLRGYLFTGFGWNGLGVAFHQVGVLMQAADLIGVTGLSFFPILIASVLVQTGRRLVNELKTGKFQAHWEVGCSVGLVAFVFAYGVNRMAYYSQQPTEDVRVLLVQQNIPQKMKWDEREEVKQYSGYVDLIDGALAELDEANMQNLEAMVSEGGGEMEMDYPDLVILPESAFTQPLVYLDDKAGIYLTPLNEVTLKQDIYTDGYFHLVFGVNMIEGKMSEGGLFYKEGGSAYNCLAVANPALKQHQEGPSQQIQTYGKNHLVPFGEYIPNLPLVKNIYEASSGSPVGSNFSKGGSYEPLEVDLRGRKIQLIPSVCFEDTVGREMRYFVRSQPQMIVNVTNDGWFGQSEAAAQQLANAKFRCVELRRPMARAANTGVSALVSTLGLVEDPETGKRRVIEDERGSIFTKGTLYGEVAVPAEATLTLYALCGDWFVILCAFLCLAGVLMTLRRN